MTKNHFIVCNLYDWYRYLKIVLYIDMHLYIGYVTVSARKPKTPMSSPIPIWITISWYKVDGSLGWLSEAYPCQVRIIYRPEPVQASAFRTKASGSYHLMNAMPICCAVLETLLRNVNGDNLTPSNPYKNSWNTSVTYGNIVILNYLCVHRSIYLKHWFEIYLLVKSISRWLRQSISKRKERDNSKTLHNV